MIVEPLILIMFIGASLALILTPGPVVSLIISETLNFGPRLGFAVVFGALTAGIIFLTVYVAGFAPLMAAMPEYVNDLIRFTGVAFLLFLSINQIKDAAHVDPEENMELEGNAWIAYKKAMFAAMANPKGILFFAAFFPQFIDQDREILPQMIMLAITFVFCACIGDSLWVVSANKARTWLHKKGGTRLIKRVSGFALGLGAMLLLFINA